MGKDWEDRMVGGTNLGFAAGQTTVQAVKFSPNFTIDKAIAVVSGDGTSATFQIFRHEAGDYDWNGQIDYLSVADWGTGIALYTLTAAPTSADIAMPSTYLANDEGERVAFASVAVTGAAGEGGITRLTDTNTADLDQWNDNAPGGIGSMAYHEDIGLFGGDNDNNQVYRWLTPLSGTSPNAERVNALKQPGGVNMTVVALSGDNVVAGTTGDESAVALSTNVGYSFNDVGLIDTTLSALCDVAVNADGSKVYLTTNDQTDGTGTYDTSVWLKSSSWKRIFSSIDFTTDANACFLVRIAPEDDAAVYISSKATKNIWVSKDSGMEKWKSVDCYRVTAVQDMAVESGDVVYALDTATGQGVSKTTNAGASWGSTKEPTKTFTGHMLTLAPNGDILLGGSTGYVAFSKDGGATFERTKLVQTGWAGNVQVVADDDYADNNIIYAGVDDDMARGKADTTSSWSDRGDVDGTHVIKGMAQIGDATYVLSDNGSESRLYMSLKMETADTAALASWSYTTATGEVYSNTPQALKLSVSDSKSKLWAIDTASPDLESYTDVTTLAGPTMVSPADGTTVAVNLGSGRAYDITFIFERYSDSDIKDVKLQVATDAAFNAIVFSSDYSGITTDTIAKVIGPYGNDGTAEFLPGTTYYWRVRTTSPLYSPWSEARSFTVESMEVAPPVEVIVPPAPPTPEIVVEPKVDVVIPPTPPVQVTEEVITPGWIYAIIVVGAVLVIAVIVLIVRTRRVV
jgi:hypothetical protein